MNVSKSFYIKLHAPVCVAHYYIFVGGKTFMINHETMHTIEMFFDHTQIHEHDFEFVVKRFCDCASFYIHLISTPKTSNQPIITQSISDIINNKNIVFNIVFNFGSSFVQDLHKYLISRNAGEIIEKGRAENKQVNEADRKILITHAHAYLSQKCAKVERYQMALVAKMLVFLVPGLQDATEGEHAGYVSLSFDILLFINWYLFSLLKPFQSVTLGYLAKKFRNANYNNGLQSKRNQVLPQTSQSEMDEPDLDFFKTVVVSNDNLTLIIEKLKSSVQIRSNIIKEVKMDFLEQFPVFFTHPILVIS